MFQRFRGKRKGWVGLLFEAEKRGLCNTSLPFPASNKQSKSCTPCYPQHLPPLSSVEMTTMIMAASLPPQRSHATSSHSDEGRSRPLEAGSGCDVHPLRLFAGVNAHIHRAGFIEREFLDVKNALQVSAHLHPALAKCGSIRALLQLDTQCLSSAPTLV